MERFPCSSNDGSLAATQPDHRGNIQCPKKYPKCSMWIYKNILQIHKSHTSNLDLSKNPIKKEKNCAVSIPAVVTTTSRRWGCRVLKAQAYNKLFQYNIISLLSNICLYWQEDIYLYLNQHQRIFFQCIILISTYVILLSDLP